MNNIQKLRKLAAEASKKRASKLAEALEVAELRQQISVANNTELTEMMAASALAAANLKRISDIKAKVASLITSSINSKGERLRVFNSHNYEFKDPLLRETLNLATACTFTSPSIKGQIGGLISPLTLLELEGLVEAAGSLPYWSEKKFTLVSGVRANTIQLEKVYRTVLAKLDIEASCNFITESSYDSLFSEAEEKARLSEKAFKKLQNLTSLIKTI